MSTDSAWYWGERAEFLGAEDEAIVGTLANAASTRGWHIEKEQNEEWRASVRALQGRAPKHQRERLEVIRAALSSPEASAFTDVILEYDFRRRGLRIDCVLLAPGLIAVLEFKRSKIAAADRDQVMHYCVSLMEFHKETQRACGESGVIVVPLLVQTKGNLKNASMPPAAFHPPPWSSILGTPIECGGEGLTSSLAHALKLRRCEYPINPRDWQASKFSPSSTILDAAISLFGHHDVSAIDSHALPAQMIDDCTTTVREHIAEAKAQGRPRIIFVSGAPGAGKTLVGLKLAFAPDLRQDSVFVTGNAPLVDVLSLALKHSYKRSAAASSGSVVTGYPRESVHHVIKSSTFKIVKAHRFLGERGHHTGSSDGSIVIFDEAQRTYEKGRVVAGHALPDHEADLVLKSLRKSYGSGAVVVALIGHKQAINKGERGIEAWFEAAEACDWDYAIGEETLAQLPADAATRWAHSKKRLPLAGGHLSHSMRFYRNKSVEEWADAVLDGSPESAAAIAGVLDREGQTVWLARDLEVARGWARAHRVGEERMGLIASGQARRLAAEGLFVSLKPPIGHWMLAPSGDIRSSNMLEVVQNTYQVQGLELDYTVVCWDADLRREGSAWGSHKISGAGWQRDKGLEVAKNGYRVLLTRARKGMVIFVPRGDRHGEDPTRDPAFYDGVADHLEACGAVMLPKVGAES